MPVYVNRAHVATTTTGTGAITLGTAVSVGGGSAEGRVSSVLVWGTVLPAPGTVWTDVDASAANTWSDVSPNPGTAWTDVDSSATNPWTEVDPSVGTIWTPIAA